MTPNATFGTICGVAVVVSFQLVLLDPLHETMDLPVWDESNQMAWGADFAEGSGTLGELAASPLYNLAYAVLAGAFGRVASVFAMKYLVTVLVALALWLMLDRSSPHVAPPLWVAVLWVATVPNLDGSLLVYHFGLALFIAATAAGRDHPPLALVLLALCSLARLEFLLPLVAYGGALAVRRWRRGGRAPAGRPRSLGLAACGVLLALAAYTAVHVDGWDVGGKRAWHAFGQHYAVAEREAGRTSVNPWVDYHLIVRRDFGGSTSTAEAARANPAAFARHTATNLRRMPGAARSLATPLHFDRLRPAWVLVACWLLLPVVVALGSLRRLSSAVAARARMLGDRGLIAGLGALATLPCLVVRPKPIYLFPLVPLAGLTLVVLVSASWETVSSRSLRRVLAAGTVVLTLGVAGLTLAAGRPYDRPSRVRPVLDKVARLERLWPDSRHTLVGVGASSYANYLGRRRCTAIEPFATVAGGAGAGVRVTLGSLVADHDPDAILINSLLVDSAQFDRASLRMLNPAEWRPVAFGDELLLLRTRTADSPDERRADGVEPTG
ncbi:MAG TPA: hypothetical protein VD788_12785 [Candidatus Polarisedimenticolaceae bacterium]|nr:hypothetical protein [Candidatus Polarisedimenticolaceae bacterium]